MMAKKHGCGPVPDAGFTIEGEPPVCTNHEPASKDGPGFHRDHSIRFQDPAQVAARKTVPPTESKEET